MIKISLITHEHNETNRPWYDTKVGITEAVKTIAGFGKLIIERHTAGYERDESLNEFIVFGIYFLDTNGNCSRAEQVDEIKSRLPNVPDVLTRKEFSNYVVSNVTDGRFTTMFDINDGNVPRPGLKCSHCGKTWDISNIHDSIVWQTMETISLAEYIGKTLGSVKEAYNKRDDAVYKIYSELEDDYVIQPGDEASFNVWTFYHNTCNREHLLDEYSKKFKGIFENAGFRYTILKGIPNEYCSCDRCAPWFVVNTEFGRIIIGWRKRVINIDWSKIDSEAVLNIINLFNEEDVTKGKTSIHAWGWEKAQEYLKIVFQYLNKVHE